MVFKYFELGICRTFYLSRFSVSYRKECAVQGVGSMSVDWGAWAGAGMAVRAGLARMERLGVGAIAPSAGLAALGRLLTGCHAGEPCSQAIACVLRWDRCARFIWSASIQVAVSIGWHLCCPSITVREQGRWRPNHMLLPKAFG